MLSCLNNYIFLIQMSSESLIILPEITLEILPLKRQTHMFCMICNEVAETYNQNECFKCKSILKWSIPWKNNECKNRPGSAINVQP